MEMEMILFMVATTVLDVNTRLSGRSHILDHRREHWKSTRGRGYSCEGSRTTKAVVPSKVKAAEKSVHSPWSRPMAALDSKMGRTRRASEAALLSRRTPRTVGT